MGRQPKQSKDQLVNQVESYRTKRGFTRQQLADTVGVHLQTIGYIERGEYAPTLALALRLAVALNCKVEDLYQTKVVAE
jgi:DNA-binding XRE family transcriptional regulator